MRFECEAERGVASACLIALRACMHSPCLGPLPAWEQAQANAPALACTRANQSCWLPPNPCTLCAPVPLACLQDADDDGDGDGDDDVGSGSAGLHRSSSGSPDREAGADPDGLQPGARWATRDGHGPGAHHGQPPVQGQGPQHGLLRNGRTGGAQGQRVPCNLGRGAMPMVGVSRSSMPGPDSRSARAHAHACKALCSAQASPRGVHLLGVLLPPPWYVSRRACRPGWCPDPLTHIATQTHAAWRSGELIPCFCPPLPRSGLTGAFDALEARIRGDAMDVVARAVAEGVEQLQQEWQTTVRPKLQASMLSVQRHGCLLAAAGVCSCWLRRLDSETCPHMPED